MESLLPGGHEKFFPHHLLRGVVWELEVVDTGVDGRVGAVSGVDLPHNGQTGEQIGQAA